jgi:predicted flap endonuclease-1-like 5' DNA nuclease
MTAISLLVQSALLVLVAYFLGAWLGCVLRRLASRGRGKTVAETAPAAGAVVPTQPVARFNEALAGQGHATGTATARSTEPPPSAPQPAPSQTYAPVAPTIETIPDRSAPQRATRTDAPPGHAEAAATTATPAPKKDDLALIRGVDDLALETLAAAGIRSFIQLGALNAEEVRRLDAALGSRGRVARENWIEQAQMLAANRATAYAVLRGGQAEMALAAPTPDQGTPLTIGTTRSTEAPKSAPVPISDEAANAAGLAAATAASAAAALTSQPTPTLPTSDPTPTPGETTSVRSDEDLQRIAGITPEIDELLKSRGIRRYSQIAGWTSDDVQRIERLLGVPGRVANENWVGQARALAGEAGPAATGEPEPQDLLSAPGVAPVANLVGLRSVKSPAFTGGESARPASPGQPADLKRIRGIGVMIEKRLHMLGVHSYEQIANWTRSDIDRVSRELDFKGRIERENWVEQARILVAGGQTSFSRRFDSRSSSN